MSEETILAILEWLVKKFGKDVLGGLQDEVPPVAILLAGESESAKKLRELLAKGV